MSTIPTVFVISVVALLVFIAGISIATSAVVTNQSNQPMPWWDPGFSGRSAKIWHKHGPITVNGTIPTQDLRLELPVGTYVLKWRVFLTGTSASSGQNIQLVLQTQSTGFYDYFNLLSLSNDAPTILESTSSEPSSYGMILDGAADIVIATSTNPASTIGLLFENILSDTLTVLHYEALMIQIP